jgi:hypothetical protein
VGAEVSEPFVGNDRVHCSQLPAGRVVTAIHYGPTHALAMRMQRSALGAPSITTRSRNIVGNLRPLG